MINVSNLTKSYGFKKGVFNLNFTVNKGEVFGFLGPNGAGKTTTIRQLLGFITPDKGQAFINDLDCFKEAHIIQARLGYIPGEIAFIDHMSGKAFLQFLADMRHMHDDTKMKELIDLFDLDVSGQIRKMSKGMKQKLAIVSAFMHDPDILILDEPTSGLDPLMQTKFVGLIKREQARGKTILMSSHNFEEVERTCDRALIIKHGEQMALKKISDLKDEQRKLFLVTVSSKKELDKLLNRDLDVRVINDHRAEVSVTGSPQAFIQILSECQVLNLDVKHQSLEDIFMNYYQEDGGHDE